MSFDSEEFAKVAPMIVFGCNIGYGGFLLMLSIIGPFIGYLIEGIVGMGLGLVMILISWMFLKPPHKNEGWMYAFIMNIITIPVTYILLPYPIWAFPITFAVLIIIIMIVPLIRKQYT
jgi:hypothetical protein